MGAGAFELAAAVSRDVYVRVCVSVRTPRSIHVPRYTFHSRHMVTSHLNVLYRATGLPTL